ncbi:MAG: nucleotidyltransferase family protein [Saprospirales bacterium]|nr:nucleotidyltransferase family protein [Saprospirales bacterium]
MKAMLLAAGLGTRLKPLTDHKPKALVEVGGMTLLERSIHLLKRYGVDAIILNVHHYGELIVQFLEKKAYFGIPITLSDERDQLLDTGGGLKKASWFFDTNEPFLIYNVDVLTNMDLGSIFRKHQENSCLATLAVRHREASRYFLFDSGLQLAGWRNRKTDQIRWCGVRVDPVEELAFSGIQVLDPAIFSYFPEENVFSLVELYLRCGAKEKICGFIHDDSLWMDAGKVSDLEEAERLAKSLGS